MDEWLNYVVANASWIFSGIGVFALSGLAWFIKTSLKKSNKQNQKIEGGSTGYQSGGNMSFGKVDKKND